MKKHLLSFFLLVLCGLTGITTTQAQNEVKIGKQHITVSEGRMTPEALWAMGRISSYAASPDGQHIVYQ